MQKRKQMRNWASSLMDRVKKREECIFMNKIIERKEKMFLELLETLINNVPSGTFDRSLKEIQKNW
jgi:hypothetical protein